jgi:hypothetical protein
MAKQSLDPLFPLLVFGIWYKPGLSQLHGMQKRNNCENANFALSQYGTRSYSPSHLLFGGQAGHDHKEDTGDLIATLQAQAVEGTKSGYLIVLRDGENRDVPHEVGNRSLQGAHLGSG